MYRFDTVCLYGFGKPHPPPPLPSSCHSRVAEVDSTSVTKVLLERGMDRSHKSSLSLTAFCQKLITKNPKKNCLCVPSPTTYSLKYYTTHAGVRQAGRQAGMRGVWGWMMAALLTLPTASSLSFSLSLSLCVQSVNLTERK
jgi:hypothetical protein